MLNPLYLFTSIRVILIHQISQVGLDVNYVKSQLCNKNELFCWVLFLRLWRFKTNKKFCRVFEPKAVVCVKNVPSLTPNSFFANLSKKLELHRGKRTCLKSSMNQENQGWNNTCGTERSRSCVWRETTPTWQWSCSKLPPFLQPNVI